MEKPLIGILGGFGPYASTHLVNLITQQTQVTQEQEHFPILLYSMPSLPDRSEFLLRRTEKNPGELAGKYLQVLLDAGARYIIIPCNTFHAPEILAPVQALVKTKGGQIIHLIDSVKSYLALSSYQSIGVLSTLGTREVGIYKDAIEQIGKRYIDLDDEMSQSIHDAIYTPKVGLKAQMLPPTQEAIQTLMTGIEALQSQGAEVVVLGCTELSCVADRLSEAPLPRIDPLWIVAREVIAKSGGIPI